MTGAANVTRVVRVVKMAWVARVARVARLAWVANEVRVTRNQRVTSVNSSQNGVGG